MPTAKQVFLGLTVVAAVVLTIYATYLFFYRLKRREKPVKSFGAWLRDLIDIAAGLG